MWERNFGPACQSVSWPNFLKVAKKELESAASDPRAGYGWRDDDGDDSGYAPHPHNRRRGSDASDKSPKTPPPSEPNPHRKRRQETRKSLCSRDVGDYQGSPMPEVRRSNMLCLCCQLEKSFLTAYTSPCDSLHLLQSKRRHEVEVWRMLRSILRDEVPLSRVLRYTLLEPQRQEMEAASGEKPKPYPPISLR